MKIYLVTGQSGSYSDWAMWFEKAFVNKEDADAHAESLTANLRAYISKIKETMPKAERNWAIKEPELDAAWDAWYTAKRAIAQQFFLEDFGAEDKSWGVEEIELVE